jgi:hypothetical protein
MRPTTTSLTELQRRRLSELCVEAAAEIARRFDAPDVALDVTLTPNTIVAWPPPEVEDRRPLSFPPDILGPAGAAEYRRLAAAGAMENDVVAEAASGYTKLGATGGHALMYLLDSIEEDETLRAPTADYRRDDGGLDVERLTQDGGAAARGDRAASQRLRVAAMNSERARGRPASMPPTSLRRLGVQRRRVGVERRPRRRAGSLSRARARAPDPPEPALDPPARRTAA